MSDTQKWIGLVFNCTKMITDSLYSFVGFCCWPFACCCCCCCCENQGCLWLFYPVKFTRVSNLRQSVLITVSSLYWSVYSAMRPNGQLSLTAICLMRLVCFWPSVAHCLSNQSVLNGHTVTNFWCPECPHFFLVLNFNLMYPNILVLLQIVFATSILPSLLYVVVVVFN
jgi:hypothetical protein